MGTLINHIVTKARPQLVRHHSARVTNNIVVALNKQKTTQLQKLAPPPPPPALQAQPPRSPANAVSQQRASRQRPQKPNGSKKTKIRYITADPLPESAAKIAAISKIGRNRILLIVGNGPSISEIPLEQLRDHPNIDIMSINKPDPRLWPTKFWTFFDQSQFIRHEDLWNSFSGYIFNSTSIKRQKTLSMQLKNLGGKGWSRDLMKGIYIGRSSVFAAMQLSMWMQYLHTYIVGVDMHPDGLNGKLHFYGQNPDVEPHIRKERFAKEAEFYEHAADLLTEMERKSFTFCSDYNPHKFVARYNKRSHKDIVPYILQHAARLSST